MSCRDCKDAMYFKKSDSLLSIVFKINIVEIAAAKMRASSPPFTSKISKIFFRRKYNNTSSEIKEPRE